MDWNTPASNADTMKTYEVKQVDGDGCNVVVPVRVEAHSGESAAKQLSKVAEGTQSIKVYLDGEVMNEMGVDYWQKRVRRR